MGVIEMAENHFNNDENLKRELNKIYSYVGILDGIYPVMITSDKEFEFKPDQPDRFETGDGSFSDGAIKDYRREKPDNVNFRFHFQDSNFEFTLPSSTSRNLIEAIESTYREKPFGFIDIPIELKTNNESYRRIFRLNLSLPNVDRIIRTLKG